jgi:hypothetical protein
MGRQAGTCPTLLFQWLEKVAVQLSNVWKKAHRILSGAAGKPVLQKNLQNTPPEGRLWQLQFSLKRSNVWKM